MKNWKKLELAIVTAGLLCCMACGKTEEEISQKRKEQIVVCSKTDYAYGISDMDSIDGVPVVKENGSGFDENALKDLLAGKSPYDVIELDARNPYSYQYLRLHAFSNLAVSEILTETVSQMYPALQESAYYDGELWGIPITVLGRGICYGDALEKYNLQPEDIVTWDDLLSITENGLQDQDYVYANKQFLINEMFYQYYYEYNDPYLGEMNFDTKSFRKLLAYMKRVTASEAFQEPGSNTSSPTWNKLEDKELYIITSGDLKETEKTIYGLPAIEEAKKLRPLLHTTYFIVNPYGNTEGAIKYLEKLTQQSFYQSKNELFFQKENPDQQEYMTQAVSYFEDGFYQTIMSQLTLYSKNSISEEEAITNIGQKYENFWSKRLAREQELEKIKKTSESEQASASAIPNTDRTKITIGVLVEDTALKKSVANYNKISSQYEAEIKVYSTENLSENAETNEIALRNALLSGNPPDLINLDIGIFVKEYMEAGLLEDLYLYLQESETLSEADFRKSVLQECTYNGKLAAIPPVMTLATIIGKQEILGNVQGWTVDDVKDLAARYPECKLLGNADKVDILNLCIALEAERFWDMEKKECYFDHPDFLETLKLCDAYPLNKSKYTQADKEEQFKDDSVLLAKLDLYSIGYYKRFQQKMGKSTMLLIGYPTETGNPGSILYPIGRYGIVSTAQNKKGAWDFLEKFLSGELDDKEISDTSFSVYGWGLPVKMDKWEDALAKARLNEYTDFPKAGVLTEDEISQINNLIDHATILSDKDAAVMNILLEEIEAFFHGEKTAEDTVLVLQNRVGLLLQE